MDTHATWQNCQPCKLTALVYVSAAAFDKYAAVTSNRTMVQPLQTLDVLLACDAASHLLALSSCSRIY